MDEQKSVTGQADAPEIREDDDAFTLEDEPFAEDAAPEESQADAAPSGEADAPSEEDAATPESKAATPDAPPDEKPDAPSDAGTPEVKEPDYKALYEARLERDKADKYRAVYNQQLALTGNEAVARMIARNECGGKDYPLEDAPASAPEGGAASGTDFRAALAEIQSLYPDAAEMPTSVMKAYADGKPLAVAYAAFRSKQDAETIATLRRENDALKKAASNRAAAPVKGVNGAPPEKKDPFYEAFREEW